MVDEELNEKRKFKQIKGNSLRIGRKEGPKDAEKPHPHPAI
jgi:hypothetical protein